MKRDDNGKVIDPGEFQSGGVLVYNAAEMIRIIETKEFVPFLSRIAVNDLHSLPVNGILTREANPIIDVKAAYSIDPSKPNAAVFHVGLSPARYGMSGMHTFAAKTFTTALVEGTSRTSGPRTTDGVPWQYEVTFKVALPPPPGGGK